MDTKSGWKSSEFHLACGTQLIAFITTLSTDDMTAKITTGAIAFAALVQYLYTRYKLKMAAATQPSDPPLSGPSTAGAVKAALVALLMFGLGAPAFAQAPAQPTVAHMCWWKDQLDQRIQRLEKDRAPQQQQGPSAEVVALQQQVQQLNGLIQQMMLQQRQAPAPAPIAPPPGSQQPPIAYHYHLYAPQTAPAPAPAPGGGIQLNPNPGPVIPLNPNPGPVIPLNPNPGPVIPLNPNPGPMILINPHPGGGILINPNPGGQPIPMQPAPKAAPIPLMPIAPADPKAAPIQLQPNAGPPTGYQRLTSGGLVLRDPYANDGRPIVMTGRTK